MQVVVAHAEAARQLGDFEVGRLSRERELLEGDAVVNRLVPEPAFEGQLIDPRWEPVSGRRCAIVDDRATVQHLDLRKRDWTLGARVDPPPAPVV